MIFELKNIEKCTCDSFLHSMLTCTLRLMDVNIIIRMGFFTGDLHRHIEQIHSKQFAAQCSTPLASIRDVTYFQGEETYPDSKG